MSKQFDLIVIGTGPSGGDIASKCSNSDLNVAIIDSRGYGGTCPLRGCNPKKVLTSATNIIDQNARMQGNGLETSSKINWQDLIAFKRNFTEPVPEAKEKSLKDAGVTTFHGEAQFIGEKEVQVGNDNLKASKIIIATGASPVSLPIEGEEHLTYSDEFLELEELPERIIFVGGGYISFEFAHIAARSGSEVHIIQRGEQPLKGFDQDLVNKLVKKSTDIGVNVHLNASVKEIEKTADGYTVKADKNGEEVTWQGDIAVHGGGRAPEIDALNLEKANVAYEKGGITVNEFMQNTSNPNIYAAGDVANTSGSPLTPVGHLEAEIVAENILQGNQKTADYTGVPSVVFTTPKLAAAGMSEEEAKESSLNVDINYMDIADWFTYKHTNENIALVKIITDKDSDHIIGAHLLTGKADELINYFAMAIQLKLTTAELKKVTYAFPTAVSDIPSML
ncbi:NAD(P)/FAD-dependent oxidoreductase [Virgibacillus sp. NKC19-16]|uniref:dihydrolipoyl dehydrogenase family protein n=1 Tax=Virgibacillus salidurans TaxID=2831673 RepID=UPI001F194755|nr:NAD(P)/FAD-dependent oxidoreductase [Virgibacillus sp. NKC19-16]UJL47337.1 NAD(P)/FAD-dependent oxidoreductase [Virgibacillus sp. NKC19-16]